MKLLHILCLISLFPSSLYCTRTLGGNSGTSTETFSFSANKAAFYPHATTPLYFTGRSAASLAPNADETERSYALAGCFAGGFAFVPLTPELATVNGSIEEQTNPLNGQQIAYLYHFRGMPLAVRADAPQYLYTIVSSIYAQKSSILATTALKDAQGAVDADGTETAGVVGISASYHYMFAAVKPNGGNFGDAGGGIALVGLADRSLAQQAAVPNDTGIKALPLDITSDAIKITNDAASLSNNIVDMWWDDYLQRLYIVFQATAGAGGGDGVRGIVMAVPYNNKLYLYPFAPAGAFAGTDYIVGGVGAGTVTTLRKFRTMFTTTSNFYGIVVGNADDAATSARTVYALPLVNQRAAGGGAPVNGVHGALASKVVDPGTNLTDYFNQATTPKIFVGRGFQVPATTTADLTSKDDIAAKVGAGLAPGTITDIQVEKDVVFIATRSSTTQSAGIFSSQALFDEYGAIKAWTPWQRVYRSNSDTTLNVFNLGYDALHGTFFIGEGTASNNVVTYKTTTYVNSSGDGLLGGVTGNASVGFIPQVTTELPASTYGVQSLEFYPSNFYGLSQVVNQRLSLCVVGGYSKVLIIETGNESGGVFAPHKGDFATDKLSFTDGSISQAATAATRIISVSGGQLEDLQGITSSTLVNDGNFGYLVVAGTGGVAVLRNNVGQGWPTAGLQKAFANLGTDKQFEKIGSYKNVRKVWANGTDLYILTADTLDRIPAGQLAQASPTAYTIATPATLLFPDYGSFSDILISGKLGLLATSVGLYRTSNGIVVGTLAGDYRSSWTKITFSQSPESVTRLYGIAPTGLPYDVAQQAGGGNVYVLSGLVSSQLSATYRLSIQDLSSTAVTDTAVQQFADYLIYGTKGSFIQWGEYRNYVIPQGVRVVAQRASYCGASPVVEDAPRATTGVPFTQRQRHYLPFDVTGSNALLPLTYSTLGGQLLATNTGMQVVE